MTAGSDRDYHVARARAELDAAYRAEQSDVAAVHFRLCALHMRRAQGDRGPASPLELDWLERFAPLHRAGLGSVLTTEEPLRG